MLRSINWHFNAIQLLATINKMHYDLSNFFRS